VSKLTGKVVIITGASRGIGAAAARVVAAQGASVVLAARDEQALERLVADIARLDGEATAVATDVADEVAVDRLVATTLDRYGSLHGAFNNAGSGHRPTPWPRSIRRRSSKRSLSTCAASSSVSGPSFRSSLRAGRSST
jgi:NAD(P)-dependent dehydrogenase (short-subunit alcohol dehydrogenase family)